MPITPVAGKHAVAEIEASPNDLAVPGTDWTLDLDPNSQEADNFKDGVLTLPTLEVATLDLTLLWDSAAPPHLTAQGTLKNGTNLAVNLYTDAAKTANKAFVFTGQVTKAVLANGGMKDKLTYKVTARGSVAYPES